MTETEIRAQVEAQVIRAGSLRALCREWGVSPAYLSDFLTGRRAPGPRILDHLGLVREVTVRYVPGVAGGRRRRISH